MENKYKIGDKVRIIDNSDLLSEYKELCPNGSIVEIRFVNYDEAKIWIDKDKTISQWVDFKNIESANDKIPKDFKIGDLVRIMKNRKSIDKYKQKRIGEMHKITQIVTYNDAYPYVLEGDSLYLYSKEELELVEDIKIQDNKKPKKQVTENTIRHIIIGRKTIVLSRDSNGKTMKGEAICHKTDDEFDVYEGLRVATARMFNVEPFPRSEIASNTINNTISDDIFNYIVNEGIVVVCETKEEANNYLKYLHNKGYIWKYFSSRSLLNEDNEYSREIGNVCYYLEEGKEVSYSGMGYAKGGDYITKKYKELVNKPSIHQLKTLSAYSTEELLEEIKSRTK